MTTPSEQDVSVVVRRRIHPELQVPFEAWLTGIIAAAASFEGHLGAQVLRPPDPANQDYVLLFRYETQGQLAAWQQSETARDWLARGKEFTMGEAHVQTVTGLEFWFRVPATAGRQPPARYKMVAATVIGLYPLILFVAPVVSSNLPAGLPQPVNALLTVVCMVLLMTYAVMPLAGASGALERGVVRPWACHRQTSTAPYVL